MMLGTTIIAQWITIICLIIRMRMLEKEVENIQSWEMFAKICAGKWSAKDEGKSNKKQKC